jgi:hypothetical protein
MPNDGRNEPKSSDPPKSPLELEKEHKRFRYDMEKWLIAMGKQATSNVYRAMFVKQINEKDLD